MFFSIVSCPLSFQHFYCLYSVTLFQVLVISFYCVLSYFLHLVIIYLYIFHLQVRYPVLLTPAEKQMARDVCIAFRQGVKIYSHLNL